MRNLSSSELEHVVGGMQKNEFETIYVSTFDPWSLSALLSIRTVSADNGYYDFGGGGAVGGGLAHAANTLADLQPIAAVYGADAVEIAAKSPMLVDLIHTATERGIVFTADSTKLSSTGIIQGGPNAGKVYININTAQLNNVGANIVSSLAHELGHALGHPTLSFSKYASETAFVDDYLRSEAYAAITAIDVSKQLEAKGVYIPIGQQDPTSRTAIYQVYEQYRTADANTAIQKITDLYRTVQIDHDLNPATATITYQEDYSRVYREYVAGQNP